MTDNKLFDAVAELRHETLQLTIKNEKIRQESIQGLAPETPTQEKSSAIEQKIFSLQEELTDLHRRKGEHAQQIVDLTSKLQGASKALALKEARSLFLNICCSFDWLNQFCIFFDRNVYFHLVF